MGWEVTKTYGHDLGLSCCFRQWRSDSHCRFLHGYALSFSFVFRRRDTNLDQKNWVIDYGDMKSIRAWLKENYDHRTVVAEDDPELETFLRLHDRGLLDLRVIPKVSIEMFALEAGSFVVKWLAENHPEVALVRAEVREHGSNAATWSPDSKNSDEADVRGQGSASQKSASDDFDRLLRHLVEDLKMPPEDTPPARGSSAEEFDSLLGQLTDELKMPPKNPPKSESEEGPLHGALQDLIRVVDRARETLRQRDPESDALWEKIRRIAEGKDK